MITTQNIYKAIKTRLTTLIPSINCQIKDIKNISAPCLYIEPVQSSLNLVADNTYKSIEIFNVVYFSKAETLLDLTVVEKQLIQAFIKPLKVIYGNSQQKFLTPEISTDIDENEYVFSLVLNFDFLQESDDENPYDEYINELDMEELNVNYTVG